MTDPELDADLADVADVAGHIVEAFAAEHDGVAAVIPSAEISDRLEDLVESPDQFDRDEWDDLVLDVKDAVLEQGVVIAATPH